MANRVTPWLDDGDVQLYHGDVINVLRQLPAGIAQTCVTSPPYWGLRDYGTGEWAGGDEACDHLGAPFRTKASINANTGTGTDRKNGEGREPMGATCTKCGAERVDSQLGLEATPDLYVERMVAVFREVRRVLRDDGTVWLNLGDSYAGTGRANHDINGEEWKAAHGGLASKRNRTPGNLKEKDLVGIPWRVAFALQQPFYTGRISAERDRVWLAATLDAEGTICGFRHERPNGGGVRTGVLTFITNTSEVLLDECDRIWPGSRYTDTLKTGDEVLGAVARHDCWRWELQSAEDRSAFVRELYPYLIVKRRQAMAAWNMLEMVQAAKRMGRGGETAEIKGKRDLLARVLSDLNQRRPVDLPSWLREPPSLHEQGWYLRSDIVWSKNNPMPESVTDRPTKAHEYLFLLSKRPRYFYDADAIREPHETALPVVRKPRSQFRHPSQVDYAGEIAERKADGYGSLGYGDGGRNRRSVWTIATEPFPEAHFATYPQELVRPCILAGTSEHGECAECGAPWVRETSTEYENPGNRTTNGDRSLERRHETAGFAVRLEKRVETTGWRSSCHCDAPTRPQTVLDPFVGSGTTALVARHHGRRCIGIDLSAEYLEIAARRTQQLGLFGGVA